MSPSFHELGSKSLKVDIDCGEDKFEISGQNVEVLFIWLFGHVLVAHRIHRALGVQKYGFPVSVLVQVVRLFGAVNEESIQDLCVVSLVDFTESTVCSRDSEVSLAAWKVTHDSDDTFSGKIC